MRSLVLLLLAAVAACAPRPLAIIGASVLPMDRPGAPVLENQAVFVRSVRIVQVQRVGGKWIEQRTNTSNLNPRSIIANPETASAVFP